MVPNMALIEALPAKEDIFADWHDMLAYQIADLKPCEYYWKKLPLIFDWLYGTEKI